MSETLTVRVLGLELVSIEASTDDETEDDTAVHLSGGTCAAYPVGFTANAGDQRWESGVEQ